MMFDYGPVMLDTVQLRSIRNVIDEPNVLLSCKLSNSFTSVKGCIIQEYRKFGLSVCSYKLV